MNYRTLSVAHQNLLVCQKLILGFLARGLQHIVLCPGSRSGPLALAIGALSNYKDFELITSIDERSAAFFALGLTAATGKATAVVTTSGTAVANLLPAAIEADRSSQPLLFLTADRPIRLKNCGSNQTVNQEEFLGSVCRSFEQGPAAGVHLLNSEAIEQLVETSWNKAHDFFGPVHLNLPIEEPLNPTLLEQKQITKALISEPTPQTRFINKPLIIDHDQSSSPPRLDPISPGLILVGPWRGNSQNLSSFRDALKKWQKLSGWPIFADPLSGLTIDQPGFIGNWEILLCSEFPIANRDIQILRLGPLPASRCLERWLEEVTGKQVLITEGDARKLDPLKVSIQWSGGLENWWQRLVEEEFIEEKIYKYKSNELFEELKKKDQLADTFLDLNLPCEGPISEPALARWLPRLLPADLPIMLAASSPVRDWLSYAGLDAFRRRCYGFRGASGIDGTLSLGMGLAMANGPTVLITGDIALLHDCNGWLFSQSVGPPLVVFLIDNCGGGIFNRLNLQTESRQTFERLFEMPQSVDLFSLVKAYGVSYRQVSCFEDLSESLDWGLAEIGPVLIRVCTNSKSDSFTRNQIIMLLDRHLQASSRNLN